MRRAATSILFACLVLISSSRAAAQCPAVLLQAWGSFGSAPGQLKSPYGIAIDPRGGHLYVTDQYNFRVCKFTLAGDFVLSWGSLGSGDGQFQLTIGLAVDQSGTVYVADFGNNRIQAFSEDGTFLRKWGTLGTAAGQFRGPRDVCVTSNGELAVTDFLNNRVQRFTAQGAYVGEWNLGSPGRPTGIVEDADGNFLVCTQWVAKWSPEGSKLMTIASYGNGVDQLSGSEGIALDAAGNIYVADHQHDRIQAYSPAGQWLCGWGTSGLAPGAFQGPADVAVGRSGEIYAVDLNNHRIQVFTFPPIAVARTTWGALKVQYR